MNRNMTMDDYDSVYALWMSCQGMGLNNLDDSKEGIERFIKRNPETCFVAETEGRIIGTILAGNDGRRGYIYHTAVHPDYQGQGIGKALVNRAMDALSKLGINKAALVVFGRNEKGNAFWEKLGFIQRNDLCYRNRSINDFERIDT
ncbi:MAG: GNAT family N-acetyltransferase [Clostridium sp.]|nr:GNAT family N-acetyltransferase [Clostridium sp.]